jgi:lipoprotein-anchoring transpeptidase ErfK/SrfK
MPYSVFFLGGYAIHGTTDIAHLGRPVSHGCIRLHPDNARKLFSLIRTIGMKATAIVINR